MSAALSEAARSCLVFVALVASLAGCSRTATSSDQATNENSSAPIITKPAAPIRVSEAQRESDKRDAALELRTHAAAYRGCSIFTAGDWYNSDVTTAATDPYSALYISSITATDDTGFYASTGIEQVNFATAATQKYVVMPQVKWHAFPNPYPVPAKPYIEMQNDRHYIVLLASPPHCHLYESYSTTFDGSTLSAYSGADWDLGMPFRTLPNGSPSAMASGLSLFAGMVKHEEIATGIKHALNFSMFEHTPCNCFTAPASSTGGLAYQGPATDDQFPFGGRLRLKASFDDSTFGPQSKAIAEALKHFGMFLADTGKSDTNNNAIYLANPADGGSWDANDLSALAKLRYSDFEVVKLGKITPK